jgi:S1-C subfamily serine protease
MRLTYALFGSAVGLVILPLFGQIPLLAKTISEVNQVAKGVTVLIQGPDTGSGVMIQQDGSTYTVLTARHVVDMPGDFEVVTTTGKQYPVNARSIRKLPDLDLALIQFSSTEQYPIASIGDSNTLQEGLPVYVTGFPGRGSTISALTYNFTEGQLTARASKPQQGGYALVYTNKTLPGMSGGPVFDQEAQLVGIHGAADGQSQTLEKLNARVFMKTGFNLGIPINTFLTASDTPSLAAAHTPADPTTPQPRTVASRPRLERGRAARKQLTLQSAPNRASAPAPGTGARSSPVAAVDVSGSGDYFLAAMSQYINGNMSAAMMSCSRALQLNPRFAAAYLLRGNIRYIGQDYAAALSDYNQAVQFDARLAAAYMGRGLVQSALSNPQAAISDYTQSIQLSPDALAYYNRGVVQLNLGNQAAALHDLQKSADLALAEGNQADYDRAKEALSIGTKNCQQSIRKICDR